MANADIIDIARFPFFIGARDVTEVHDLPSYLPLKIYVDQKLAIPRVRYSPEVLEAVTRAYKFGSMLSTPLGCGALGQERMEHFLATLQSAVGSIRGKNFVEIGCGDGSLMDAIRSKGGHVVGFEIGPQGEEAKHRYGLEIYCKPLSSELLGGLADCIYSYGVLEHISELTGFFSSCRDCLTDGGLFIHSVPNTDKTYSSARLDDLSHQHVNYFTSENSRRLLESQGFCRARSQPNPAGNELYVWGNYSVDQKISWPGSDPGVLDKELSDLTSYSVEIQHWRERWRNSLEKLTSNNETIGLYAGGFAFLDILPKTVNLQFYDGDEFKHGKCWLAGLPKIKDPATLADDPVDHLIVCPEHHFTSISNYLCNDLKVIEPSRLYSLSDL